MDSRDCMDDAVAESVINLRELGKTQYQEYVKAVIKDRTISISSSIKKNKLPLFSKQPSRTKSKQSKTIKALQNNVSLFAQLYIATRTAMQTLENSFATRYSHFLHHCLNLEIFVSQVTSQS